MAYENYGKGVYGPYYTSAAPVAGVNEVQTATFAGSWAGGDTFKLSYNGLTTPAISWSNVNATLLGNINTALNALPSLGSSWVVATAGTVTNGIGTVILTFSGGDVAARAVANIVVANVTSAGGGTLAIVETTPGVTATYRDVAQGAVLVDTTNAQHYMKTGLAGTGTYVKTGTQS